ncbi:HET-domain-containing protein [Lepidopterella palustris CBS 459.81]|uniref:HET-domain-containing protein n=1 Tax=Lepidopterella palustris CBS 459.81 TaxID=1314670 RepID=A0A8E2DWW3_9PEZI|nr:HET-domain-containing protein [Lepidopterella palustris CBS 459.81]
MSLTRIDNGPKFHSVSIKWMHDGISLPEENEIDKLHAFVPEGSPLAQHIPTRPCKPAVFPSETKRAVRSWLDKCQKCHSSCKNAIEALPFAEKPARLVAVESQNEHLEETDTKDPRSYVALSYCWGDSESKWYTTQQSLNRYLVQIEHSPLPQTIKDAIYITRELGHSYLWVDALCIIQEGNEIDKRRELRKMASIYCGASVVLSAARARDSAEGFLQNRKLNEIYDTVFELHVLVEGMGTYAFLLHEHTDNSKDDPIDERGWTLQEHSLAVRLLRFGSKQTRWGCMQTGPNVDGGCHCSTTTIDPIAFNGELSSRLQEDQGQMPDDWKYDNWMKVVKEYRSRKLSKPSDCLPALGALAQMFAIETKIDARSYYAGLWAEDLPLQLLWWRDDFKDGSKAESMKTSNLSWSWASIRGDIQYLSPPHSRERITLRTIDCCIVLKDQSFLFGEVQSAKLNLDGYLRKVYWDGHVLYTPSSDIGQVVFDDPTRNSSGLLWLLHIYSNHIRGKEHGLILEKVENESVFKRIGYFEANLNSSEENWFQLHGKQMITIL